MMGSPEGGDYFWSYFKVDWAWILKKVKDLQRIAWVSKYPQQQNPVNALIVRWIGVSTEVIGSELESEVDFFRTNKDSTHTVHDLTIKAKIRLVKS